MGNVIGFIPLKGTSKGLPFKNVRLFCGMPLFYWVILEMLQSGDIDFVIISTDSDRIREKARELFFRCWLSKLFVWPSKLFVFDEEIGDKPYWDKAAIEACDRFKMHLDDVLIMAQVTSPFTQQIDFEKALELYRERNCGSVVSCAKTHRFIWQGKNQLMSKFDMVPINYSVGARPRRQEFEGTLVENGAIYINSVGNLKRYGNRLSYPISIYTMPEYTYTEIDTEDDWYQAEYLFRKYLLKESQ